jgi:hypothetical protein
VRALRIARWSLACLALLLSEQVLRLSDLEIEVAADVVEIPGARRHGKRLVVVEHAQAGGGVVLVALLALALVLARVLFAPLLLARPVVPAQVVLEAHPSRPRG